MRHSRIIISAIAAILISPGVQAATLNVAFLGQVTTLLGLGAQTVVDTGDAVSIVVSIDADAATVLDTAPLGGQRLIHYGAIVGVSGNIGGLAFHQGPIPGVGTYGNAQVYNDLQLSPFDPPQDGFILTSSLNGNLINGFDPRRLTISMGTNVNTGVFSDAFLGENLFGDGVLAAMSYPSIILSFNSTSQSIFANITSMEVQTPALVPLPLPGALLLGGLFVLSRLRRPQRSCKRPELI